MHHKIILTVFRMVILFLLANLSSVAQDVSRMTVADFYALPMSELQRLLYTHPQDAIKAKIFITLGQHWEDKPGSVKEDIDSATKYFSEAEKIIVQRKLGELKPDMAMSWGSLHYHNGSPEKARAAFLSGITFCKETGNKEQEATLWIEMSKNDGDNTARLTYLENAMALYKSLKNRLKEAETLKEIGDVHLNQGKYEQSEQELNVALSIYKELKYERIYYTYDLLSAVTHWKGDFAKAQQYAMAAIESAEKAGDYNMLGFLYWRLATAYQGANDYAKSQYYLKQSLLLQLHNPAAALTYHILGELTDQLLKDHKVDEALKYLLLVKEKRPPISKNEKIDLSFSIADCYLALKDYPRAESYYLQYVDELDDGTDINRNLAKITQFYFDRQQFKKAAVYLDRMVTHVPRHWNLKTTRDISLLQSRLDSANGNMLSALRHLQRYNELTDSAFTLEKVKQAEEMQAKFDVASKEKDNQLLREQGALQEKTLEKATLVRNVIMAGCIVLALLLGLLLNRYWSKIKTNKLLQHQQTEIRDANNSLERALGEKNKLLYEKEFLIKEIHHRVKNNLQLTMSLLNSQSKYLSNEDAIRAINDSQHRLKSISLIHQKLYQAEEQGLVNIKTYIYEVLDYLRDSFSSGERVRFNLNVEDVELDVGVAIPLGLILNEAVTNVFKYAFPDTRRGLVEVSLVIEDDQLFFAVKDNGVGLPPDFDLKSRRSLGFELIDVLSAQLDGDLRIDGNAGVQLYLSFKIDTVYQ